MLPVFITTVYPVNEDDTDANADDELALLWPYRLGVSVTEIFTTIAQCYPRMILLVMRIRMMMRMKLLM